MREAILDNGKGVPIMRVTQRAIFSTVGSDGAAKPIKSITNTRVTTFQYKNSDYVCWGENNRFPDDAELLIHRTGVLQTALNYKSRCCYGQGVIPVVLEGLDENLKDIYKPLNNIDLISFLNDYTFCNYHKDAFRDINKFGNCFPLLVPNDKGNKIVRIDAINARHCRLSVDKTKLLVYGKFLEGNPSKDEKDCFVYDILDETDPQLTLEVLKESNKLSKPIAFPRIKNYLSNNDYYARTDWWAAYKSGWIDIAHQIPEFLKKAYENAITVMWHIKIPAKFYDDFFSEKDYQTTAERMTAINKWQDSYSDNLTGTENANKALFSSFKINESGRAEEQVVIERLDGKLNMDEKLSTSAAANSEILFSLMVNPSVLGAGMPGGPYAGNAGSGSDIREGLMASLVLSYIEKQQVLEPVKLMFRFNGYNNVSFKYKNIILTTLDKGKSTEEKIQ
jgi:hypothetical protein